MVTAAMVLTFVSLLHWVVTSTGLAASDLSAVRDLADYRNPLLLTLAKIISALGSPIAMVAVAAVVCLGLTWRLRRPEPVIFGIAGVGGIELISVATKHMVARSRPPMPLHAVTANGYSFPSGHAISSTLVILLCTAMLTGWLVRRPGPRAIMWFGACVTIAAVGFSRVFLGVHYPSDVLAGWSLAIAWFSLLLLAAVVTARPKPA